MRPEEVYEKWDDLPTGRRAMLFDEDESGESVWTKDVGDGLLGINNNPLSPFFRWQDIVRYPEGANRGWESRENPELIHRRWNSQVFFTFDEPSLKKESEEAEAIRRRIYDAIRAVGGRGSFWLPRMGSALFETEDEEEARRVLAGVLEPLDVGFELYEEEEEDE